MMQKKQHTTKCAKKRHFSFVQPRAVVCAFAAFTLAFSLFPSVSFAADTIAQAAQGVTTTSPSTSESIQIGSEPLALIQNGTYDPAATAAITSQKAGTAGVNYPTAEQHDRLVARLTSALMNVESATYNGSANWCIVDVSDIKATLTSSASTYAKGILEEVINGNPDIFYAGASYGAGTTTTNTSAGTRIIISRIMVKYYWAPSTIRGTMKSKYETGMQNVLKWVPPNGTQAQQAKAVHDWLVRNCSYNEDACKKGGPTGYGSWDPWSAYGAVVNKKPVCEGYSLAFIAAMRRLGIEATFVTNAGHGWNRVRLYDTDASGKNPGYYWFNLDITWDDPIPDRGSSATPSTTYFLKSDKYFINNLPNDKGQHATWTPAGVDGNNTKYDKGATPSGGSWHAYTQSDANSYATIINTLSTLSVSPTSVTLADDDSAQLTLTAMDSNKKPISTGLATWSSSNTNIVAVSPSGKISSGKTAGSATITAKLGGKEAKCSVTVKKGTRLSGATITVTTSAADLTYKSGVARKPTFKVILNGKTLTLGTDYTVSYPSDSINPGAKTATLTATTSSEYVGTVTASYTITGNLSSCAKTGSGFSNGVLTTAYNGTAQKKAPTLTFSGSLGKKITLVQGTDYTITWPSNTTTPGSKNVTITGRGAWKGTYVYKLNITALDLRTASITIPDIAYTGKARKPAVTVKVGTSTIPSTNYSVTYKNNTKVGKGTAIITGKGYATGVVTKTFNIVPKGTSVSKLTPASKAITVKWKKQAKQTTGYQIQYSTTSKFTSGNKTVTVKGAKKTSYKIKKLKAKKRYYVHVRTYKQVGGKKYYSAWSKTKSIKTK